MDPIMQAIRSLDRSDRSLWTRQGKPRVRAIESELGRDITAAQRDKAWVAVQAQREPTPWPDHISSAPPHTAPPPPSSGLLERIEKHRRMVKSIDVFRAVRDSDLRHLRPICFGDGNYTALPLDVWLEIIEWSDVDRMAYVKDKRTCSNFAAGLVGQVGLRLAADGIGIVADASGGHAYCCLLVWEQPELSMRGKLTIYIVEPQTDERARVGDRISGREAYKAQSGFILFP